MKWWSSTLSLSQYLVCLEGSLTPKNASKYWAASSCGRTLSMSSHNVGGFQGFQQKWQVLGKQLPQRTAFKSSTGHMAHGHASIIILKTSARTSGCVWPANGTHSATMFAMLASQLPQLWLAIVQTCTEWPFYHFQCWWCAIFWYFLIMSMVVNGVSSVQ